MTDTGKKSHLDEDPHGVEPDEAARALDEEPAVDGLLARLGQMLGIDADNGWSGIDDAGKGLQKQRMDAARAFKAEANIFRDTFTTDAGRRCLEIMLDRTVRSQPYPIDQFLPMDVITPLVLVHNAQCNFVWAILQAIAQADNREAKPRTFQT